MRARLFSTSSERRRPARPRRGPARRKTAARALQPPERAPRMPDADVDVERAQHAGGPVDVATYTCGCGYLFVAQVSTTVRCPHCGSSQAW